MTDELSRLKALFLASLNHEIRTPLSGIMGMTDLLLESKLDGEQRDFVLATRSCAESLLTMFNATLEFSSLSSGGVALEEIEFDVAATIRSAADAHAQAARAKGIGLETRLDAGLPPIAIGDPFRLRQLLSCVIDNGVKFTHAGQVTIEVAVRAASEARCQLAVSVADTGIGIEPRQLPFLFEPFHQLDNGLSRRYTGLGLGLALARKLTHLMGGEISVESEPGRGSTFFIVVPIQLPTALAAEPPPRSPRILLVEDNAVAQRVTTHILRRRSFDVTCVADGAAAVAAASTRDFDLILMDLQMPGMDGFTTMASIRRFPGYDSVPVLALTANATDEYRRRCLQQGMQGFLSKPVEPDDLLDAVASHLAAARCQTQ